MRFIQVFLTAVVLTWGCGNVKKNSSREDTGNSWARGFTIEPDAAAGATKLTVFNPWEKAQNVSYEYYLLNRESKPSGALAGKKVIFTPVERVICLSTTHLAFLDALGETGAVTGISGSRYISNSKIRQRMEQGEVPDVGYGQNLNYELIVSLKPDLVMVYGIGSEVTSYVNKLEELNIPVVMVAEYLEASPLGRAEWIKFIGALFEKEDTASVYFSRVEKEYIRLRELAADEVDRPQVLVGSPYKDAWWVPGGNSYMANLIADAGGDYPGSNNTSHESYVISFENALAWGSRADVWINMGNLSSRKEILSADQRFGSLGVFNRGKTYNNIKRLSSHGGNDFWESGTVNPHLILRDLIAVFHPHLAEEELVYYSKIE